MKKYSFHLFTGLVALVLMSVVGCRHTETVSGLKHEDRLALKSSNGLYVCADNAHSRLLLANRETPSDWETFTVLETSDEEIILKSFHGTFVGADSSCSACLSAHISLIDSAIRFQVSKTPDGTFVLRTSQGDYVRLREDSTLTADCPSAACAEKFKLVALGNKSQTAFDSDASLILIAGMLLIAASLLLFHLRERKRLSVLLLLAGGFLVRFFMIMLDVHLNVWDEQFHALVAKNMMTHPFKPMLYANPVIPYNYQIWVGNHVWLHKQPLFLWQMALSMKIFGVNTIALRLPSALMSTMVIGMIYRTGSITVNKTAGYYGAILFAMSHFVLKLVAGVENTDHNDVAFLFYVAASIWAWIEYGHSPARYKVYWAIATGVLAGCAVLVKWLTGLLVFSGWGLSVLLVPERRKAIAAYFHLLLSVAIAALVFLPWQIYIHHAFPLESAYEAALNTRHFFEAVEGHSGNFWYHFDQSRRLYGVAALIVVLSVVIFVWQIKSRVYRWALLSYIILIYLFFGIAATKMVAFTFCLSFLIFLAFGTACMKFFEYVILNPAKLKYRAWEALMRSAVVAVLAYSGFRIEEVQSRHVGLLHEPSSYEAQWLSRKDLMMQLNSYVPDLQNSVVFNCPGSDVIPLMFFNDLIAAYPQIPDEAVCNDLLKQGYRIVVFDNGQLPPYLYNKQSITLFSAH